MAEYTSLAMGAGTGLVVFFATLLYMKRKAKAIARKFGQGDADGRAPEMAAQR